MRATAFFHCPSVAKSVGFSDYFDFSSLDDFMSSGFGELVGNVAEKAAGAAVGVGIQSLVVSPTSGGGTGGQVIGPGIVGGIAGIGWPGNASTATTQAEATTIRALIDANQQLAQQQAQQAQGGKLPEWVLPAAIGGAVLVVMLFAIPSRRRA